MDNIPGQYQVCRTRRFSAHTSVVSDATLWRQVVPRYSTHGCLCNDLGRLGADQEKRADSGPVECCIQCNTSRSVQLRSVYGSRLWQFPGGDLDTQGENPLQTAQREAVEETGLELGLGAPRLLLTHFLHTGPHLPLNKVGFVFDGGQLTADQLRCIRLDPEEHDMWAVYDMADWQELMAPRDFARLDAVERARRADGPAYLCTHT